MWARIFGIIIVILFLFGPNQFALPVTDANGSGVIDSNSRVDYFYQPAESWNKTYGGSDSEDFRSILQTSDGGYIMLGTTFTFDVGWGDIWLVKTDSSGSQTWNKTFGGSDSDRGYAVQHTADGGFIIIGHTSSYGGTDDDFWLIKTDSSGNKQWDKVFGGQYQDLGYHVSQTSDGGYILTGDTNSYGTVSDLWLIKTDSQGTKQWDKTFPGLYMAVGYSVTQAADGGYIVTGSTTPSHGGDYDLYLLKTNATGAKEWERSFGTNYWEYGETVIQTTDGNYIVAGWTGSYGNGDTDAWLLKIDQFGNEKWNKTYGGTDSDNGNFVLQTNDGGYLIVGETRSYGTGKDDVWVVRTDSNGTRIWDIAIGGPKEDEGYSGYQTSDGGYIIGGFTESWGTGTYSGWIIKINETKSLLPVADFSFTPPFPTDLDQINFYDKSTGVDGTVVSWHWDFGDGGTNITRDTNHKYTDNGTYEVTLTVTDDRGAYNHVTKEIEVLNVAPRLAFSFSPLNATTLDTVYFVDGSTDPDGTIVGWSWDFGDSGSSTDRNPVHTYSLIGTYDVLLQVEDNDGMMNSSSRDIKILNGVPDVSFTYSPPKPTTLSNISFTSDATDKDGVIVKYHWDFGDGYTSSDKDPTHKFKMKHPFKVTLTVTDDAGGEGVAEDFIHIFNIAPRARFSCNSVSPISLASIQFTDESSDFDGPVTYWFWEFGDGHTSTEQNPIHYYTKDETYTIKLTVGDEEGNTSVFTLDYEIKFSDLSIGSSDITLSDPDPFRDEMLIIVAKINNDNIIFQENVIVNILIDNEEIDTFTVDIEKNDFYAIETSWLTVAGDHEITIKIDPGNKVFESNENNNIASKKLNVESRDIGSDNDGDGTSESGEKNSIFSDMRTIGFILLIIIPLMVLVVLMIFFRNKKKNRPDTNPLTAQSVYCNSCSQTGRYIDISNNWYCDSCGKYIETKKAAPPPVAPLPAQLQPAQPQPAQPQPPSSAPAGQIPAAPQAAIPQQTHQPAASQQPLVAPAPRVERSKPQTGTDETTGTQNICSTCNGSLTYIEKYQQWYCYDCKSYS